MGGGRVTAIEVDHLTFAYPSGPPVLCDLCLAVEAGARCLVLGANGAGKTTLLRILGGRHLIPERAVRVLGQPAFHATELVRRVVFIGGDFPFDVDLTVEEILERREGLDRERLARLIGILDVRPGWHMNRISSGQRRRVQILLNLVYAHEVILLDEVTADLDVIARADLLAFLKADSESLRTTVLYATHVLDGLEDWATHLLYIREGRVARYARLEEIEELAELRRRGETSLLLRLCEGWLRAERRA
jgi:CCR4-NOT complex subunit CAF16